MQTSSIQTSTPFSQPAPTVQSPRWDALPESMEEKNLEKVPVEEGLFKTDPSFSGKDTVFRVEERRAPGDQAVQRIIFALERLLSIREPKSSQLLPHLCPFGPHFC